LYVATLVEFFHCQEAAPVWKNQLVALLLTRASFAHFFLSRIFFIDHLVAPLLITCLVDTKFKTFQITPIQLNFKAKLN